MELHMRAAEAAAEKWLKGIFAICQRALCVDFIQI